MKGQQVGCQQKRRGKRQDGRQEEAGSKKGKEGRQAPLGNHASRDQTDGQQDA